MPQGNHLFLPRSPTARARSSGLLLPHVTRPNSAAESPRSPSVTLPCASSSRSHKYRSPHRYVILCPLCCHRDLATKTNSPPPLQLSFAASPSRRICCCPSRQGRPGAAIADVRRHRAASAIKTILVSPLSPPPSTHACFSRSHTRSLGPSPCFAGELRLAGNGRHLHQDPNPLNESCERRS